MKRTIVLAWAALASSGVVMADYSISTDLTFASKYVFRGVQLAENTFHPSVEFSQDAWYLGIWSALPIEGRESMGYTDEYDFYVGYTTALSDNLTVDLGGTYYYYPDGEIDDTVEAYIGFTLDIEGLTPGIYTYYDFDLEALTVQGNIGYSIPMASAGTSLDLSANYGYVDPNDGESYSYYGASAQIPYKLNDNATVTIGAHYASNDIDNIFNVEGDHFYGTIGLTIGF